MNQKKFVIVGFLIISILLFIVVILLIRGKESGDKFRIDVASNPEGAIFYIGEEGPFTTPETLYLLPGEYYLWVYKENYYTIEKNIQIEEKENEIFLNLEEVPIEIREGDDIEPQEIDPYPY